MDIICWEYSRIYSNIRYTLPLTSPTSRMAISIHPSKMARAGGAGERAWRRGQTGAEKEESYLLQQVSQLRPPGLHQTPPQAPGKLEGPAQDQAKGGGVLGGHADRQLLVSPTRWSTYIVMHLHCTCLFLLNPFNQSTVY